MTAIKKLVFIEHLLYTINLHQTFLNVKLLLFS